MIKMLMLARTALIRAKRTVVSSLPLLTYKGVQSDTSNATSYTFSSLDFGTADSTRMIVVGVTTASVGAISAVDIGGVSATYISGSIVKNLWYAGVPSGATGDIVVTCASANNCTISWYVCYTSTPDPDDNGGNDITSGSGSSTPITIPTGGFAISCAWSVDTTDRSASWTNLTKDSDAFPESGTYSNHSAASSTTAGSPSINITWTASSSNGASSWAVWAP